MTVECTKCGSEVAIEDAVSLMQRGNKAMWRYLCPSCLEDTGVPQGYELQRDLSHLEARPENTVGSETERDRSGESRVLADFTGQVVAHDLDVEELTSGRIGVNTSGVVLATDGDRLAVSLSDVVDVSLGEVAQSARQFFDDVLKIQYRKRNRIRTGFVAGDRDDLTRFSRLLLGAILHGSAIRVRHPTNVGGVPRSPAIRSGRLDVGGDVVHVSGIDSKVSIDPERIVSIRKRTIEWDEVNGTGLVVFHRENNRTIRSEFVLPSDRLQRLFGRYLQGTYAKRKQYVDRLELSEDHVAALIGHYSLGPDDAVNSLFSEDSVEVDPLLGDLQEAGLLRVDQDRAALTPEGYVAVFERSTSRVGQ
ncbi:MAG: CheF family chemotaxis protein [Halodesulfurarchaeum sp.]